jgi:hypothetical protein
MIIRLLGEVCNFAANSIEVMIIRQLGEVCNFAADKFSL